MKEAYLISHRFDEFAAAWEQFGHLVSELQSGDTLGIVHGDVENLISEEGNEVLRRLLQGYFDLRTSREATRDDVRRSDGAMRTRCRDGCERTLMSLFGEVVVRRKGYGEPGVSSLFPLDGQLSLPPDKYSHGLRKRVSREVAKGSFDAAVESVARTTGGKVPKRQAEELAVEVSQDFVAFCETRQDHRGVKQRVRPMLGFKRFTAAARFCLAHDEPRSFLRPAAARN